MTSDYVRITDYRLLCHHLRTSFLRFPGIYFVSALDNPSFFILILRSISARGLANVILCLLLLYIILTVYIAICLNYGAL